MRKLAGTLLAVAIAVVGVVGLIAFFNSRDDSTTSGGAQATTSAAAQGDGNVIVTFSAPADGRRLRALADELGAPDTPETRAAGLAVIVKRGATAGITATAGQEAVTVADPDDPQLQDFIDRWLGEGGAG
jgi:hypothetical protein